MNCFRRGVQTVDRTRVGVCACFSIVANQWHSAGLLELSGCGIYQIPGGLHYGGKMTTIHAGQSNMVRAPHRMSTVNHT